MKRFYFVVILIVCILFQNASNLYAQKMRFMTYDSKIGFPSNFVEMAAKDDLGFMWFCTYDGIVRFDGYNFKLVVPNQQSHKKTVRQFFSIEVVGSTLWLVSVSGLVEYNQLTNTFIFHDDPKLPFANSAIKAVKYVNGKIVIGTEKNLYLYNPKTKTTQTLVSNIIVSKTLLNENILYVTTESSGIFVFDVSNFTLIDRVTNKKYSNFTNVYNSVQDIKLDVQGNVWFVTSNNGFFKYNVYKNSLVKKDISIPSVNQSTLFWSLEIIDENNFWIGTLNQGLIYSYNGKMGQITMSQNSIFDLPSNTIRYIYRDGSMLWFCSHLGSIFSCNLDELQVEYFVKSSSLESSLQHNIVSSFSEDSKGNVWVGTDGGGIAVYNKNMNILKYIQAGSGLQTNAVTHLQYDGASSMYISQWNGGVSECNINSFACKSILPPQPSYYSRYESHNDVKGVFLDSQKRLWVIPHLTPIMIINTKTGARVDNTDRGGYPSELFKVNKYIDVAEDYSGNIWIYGYEQLSKLTKNNIFINYSQKQNSGLESNNIKYVYVDTKGMVWVCSDNGLFLYNPIKDIFTNMSTKHDIPKRIFTMQEDSKGNIWFTSTLGIGFFSQKTYEVTILNKNISVTGSDFIERAGFTLQSGKILFGSTKGFVAINPAIDNVNKKIPTLVVTKVTTSYTTQKEPQSLSTKSIEYADTIVVSYKDDVITLEVAALEFSMPSKNKYAYKLEGFDNTWHYIDNQRTITFTNLPHGTYKLYIKGSNNENVWNETGKVLYIIVTPAWWQTIWFKLLAILLLFLGLRYLYYRFYYPLSSQNTQLKNIIASKEEAMQNNLDTIEKLQNSKSKLLSIVENDLKQVVQSVIFETNELANQFKSYSHQKIEESIHVIHSHTIAANQVVANMIDWSISKGDATQMHMQTIHLKEMIDANCMLFSQFASTKQVRLLSLISNKTEIYADYKSIDSAIRNLLNKAVLYADNNTVVLFYAKKVRYTTVLSIAYKNSNTIIENSVKQDFGIQSFREIIEANNGELHCSVLSQIGMCLHICLSETEKYRKISEVSKEYIDSWVEMYPTAIAKDEEKIEISNTLLENKMSFEEIKYKKVLIIEEDTLICKDIERIFESKIIIESVSQENQVLSKVSDYNPDLIIIGLYMQEFNGSAICNKLFESKTTSHIPLIALVTENQNQFMYNAVVPGVVAYIAKPYNALQLQSIVATILFSQLALKNKYHNSIDLLPSELVQSEFDKKLIDSIGNIIDKNVHNNDLGPEFISKELRMGRTVLYENLKRICGLGVNEYILQYKLKRSLQFYTIGTMNISQISIEAGFSSLSHYTRSFTKLFGVTPSDYFKERKLEI